MKRKKKKKKGQRKVDKNGHILRRGKKTRRVKIGSRKGGGKKKRKWAP